MAWFSLRIGKTRIRLVVSRCVRDVSESEAHGRDCLDRATLAARSKVVDREVLRRSGRLDLLTSNSRG